MFYFYKSRPHLKNQHIKDKVRFEDMEPEEMRSTDHPYVGSTAEFHFSCPRGNSGSKLLGMGLFLTH